MLTTQVTDRNEQDELMFLQAIIILGLFGGDLGFAQRYRAALQEAGPTLDLIQDETIRAEASIGIAVALNRQADRRSAVVLLDKAFAILSRLPEPDPKSDDDLSDHWNRDRRITLWTSFATARAVISKDRGTSRNAFRRALGYATTITPERLKKHDAAADRWRELRVADLCKIVAAMGRADDRTEAEPLLDECLSLRETIRVPSVRARIIVDIVEASRLAGKTSDAQKELKQLSGEIANIGDDQEKLAILLTTYVRWGPRHGDDIAFLLEHSRLGAVAEPLAWLSLADYVKMLAPFCEQEKKGLLLILDGLDRIIRSRVDDEETCIQLVSSRARLQALCGDFRSALHDLEFIPNSDEFAHLKLETSLDLAWFRMESGDRKSAREILKTSTKNLNDDLYDRFFDRIAGTAAEADDDERLAQVIEWNQGRDPSPRTAIQSAFAHAAESRAKFRNHDKDAARRLLEKAIGAARALPPSDNLDDNDAIGRVWGEIALTQSGLGDFKQMFRSLEKIEYGPHRDMQLYKIVRAAFLSGDFPTMVRLTNLWEDATGHELKHLAIELCRRGKTEEALGWALGLKSIILRVRVLEGIDEATADLNR